jgi:hypothetical protein
MIALATPILCVAAVSLIASCSVPREPAAPAALVAPDRTRIDLHLRVTTEADAKARAVCEADVTGVLRHHGFVLDPSGVRVDVNVAVLREVVPGTPSFAVPTVYNTLEPPARPVDPGENADLNARVYVPGTTPRVLHTGGAAQTAACAVAADRFATLLVEALRAAPPPVAPGTAAPPDAVPTSPAP